MTLMITHLALQQYWWIIISLMGSILVFLMFVQGGQSMLFTLPRNETERTLVINSLGRKWEFTFTTLVTFGGTFFAAFPLFYATSFGGAYWFWTIILFSFIIQAVSYEYRGKAGNILGKKTFDGFLFVNGSLGPFLIGTIVATFFTGSRFSLNEMNQVTWQTHWYGLEALTVIRNVGLGFAVLFLARVNGLLFVINTVDNEELRSRAVRKTIMNSLFFLVFFLYFIITLFISDGYVADTVTGNVTAEKYKYLHNFIDMPVLSVLFLAGVVSVLYGIGITLFSRTTKGIWFSGSGTIAAVMTLLLASGLNNTVFYPSLQDLQSSLTISNASSSYFTLKTMMFFSCAVPFIVAYIWYAWRALTNKKITTEELSSETHKY